MTEGRCTTFAGPDRRELRVEHVGAHHTMWGEYKKRAQQRQDRSSDDLDTFVGVDGCVHQVEAQIGSHGATDESVSDG